MKNINYLVFVSFICAQAPDEYIDGVAAIVENNIVLKSDLVQMVNITASQSRIDPNKEPDRFLELQRNVLESMIDQKILLEMAEVDSVSIEEKEVDKALEQQIDLLISESGGKERAEEVIGQSISEFRREFWYDMKDRLVSEKYQQQLLSSISITRSDVVSFYNTYKDSLPLIPEKTKLRHLLVPIEPSQGSKDSSFSFLLNLKNKIIEGADFEEAAGLYSDDPGSKNNGGSLGWVTRGSLVKNFETAAFTAEPGIIVGPVETEFGFHLIETIEKKGDKIKVRHILIIPKKTNKDNKRAFDFAVSLKEDSIKTLIDFKKYVKKYTSDESTKKIGGSLGWIESKNYSIPEIGQSLKYLEKNTCSPPINSSYGLHLLWIEDIKEGGKATLEKNWTDIELMTLNKKKMDWYKDWMTKARKGFYIEIKNI